MSMHLSGVLEIKAIAAAVFEITFPLPPLSFTHSLIHSLAHSNIRFCLHQRNRAKLQSQEEDPKASVERVQQFL